MLRLRGLVIRSCRPQNAKLGPNTVLCVLKRGSVDEPTAIEADAVAFAFSKGSDPVVDVVGEKPTVTTIGDFIRTHRACKLYVHGAFAPGAPPTAFVVKKRMVFRLEREAEEDKRIIAGAQQARSTSLVWAVGVAEDKKVTPVGLAVVLTRQVISKGNADIDL